MEVKLIEQEQNQEIYCSSINTRVCFRKDFSSSTSNIKRLHINELRFIGINYLSIKLEATHSSTIQMEYSQSGYLLCFVMEGTCAIEKEETNICISANHYTCQSINKSVRITLGSISRLLFISIDSDRNQGINIIDKKPENLLPAMNTILAEIRQCTEDCPIQCIFIESKILSLIYMVFEGFRKEVLPLKNSLPIGLIEKDAEKLRAAKVYIVKNIAKNYTLIELAHQVGLNDFKLKKGFKELFGCTVFNYRQSIRMEKAKEMLQSGFQVNEVSEEIGYKHPHHFSAAFKEYFNILPSRIDDNL